MNTDRSLFEIYTSGKFLSIKHSSYFSVYERLLSQFVGKRFTFVEIGILNGGSLFMWREYFGDQARIIGLDLNPEAVKWRDYGFEIHIGDQSKPEFWRDFFQKVGPVDVVLDDGGHTNRQQIQTLLGVVDNIKDGGLLIVEDTHCSYLREFGNPSKYSFITYAKRLVDHVNARHPDVHAPALDLGNRIYCISFYESIVAFEIDRRLCSKSSRTTNHGLSSGMKDFRYDQSMTARWVERLDEQLKTLPILWRLRRYLPHAIWLNAKRKNWQLRDLFL